ncbi:ABC transporter ATP-binding protein/permease [Spongorhabdus nitratireducens]
MKRIKTFLALAAPYWKSRQGRIGWLLLLTTCTLQGLVTYSSVKFAEWNSTFYDALESRDPSRIFEQVIYFVLLLSFMSIVNVNQGYFLEWLKLHWRRWMNQHTTRNWLSQNRFYHLRQQQDVDNIDQRISEDIRLFINDALGLGFSCLSAVLSVGSFSVVLWQLSGSLDFEYAGAAYSIPGYLLFGAILYALIGFLFARVVGRKIRPLSWKNQKAEADYRGHIMRITEHNEAIAFANGADREHLSLKNYFSTVYSNSKDLLKEKRRFNLYTLFYGQTMLVAPLVLSMPRYLSGALSLGDLMQLRIAFSQVVGSLSWFTDHYASIMEWFATMDRLAEVLEKVENTGAESRINYQSGQNAIEVKDLTLFKPDGDHLLSLGQWSLGKGERYHLSSQSGSGKTSLIKALKGLWHNAYGEVRAPDDILVLSQRDFIPYGCLKTAMTYPHDPEQFTAGQYQQALNRVGLDSLADKLHLQQNWHQLLSGGERQRLVLARCFLLQPDWLILDESLSAIDETSGRKIVEKLVDDLPHTGMLCISHSGWTRQYFGKSLSIS